MRISSREAIALLKKGQVAALPTETVYGLAASLSHPAAIEEIFHLKQRPPQNPLIVHLHHPQELNDLVTALPPESRELMDAFWPGPLTLILPAQQDRVPALVRAGLPTVACRVPSLLQVREILRETGPLVMPSANRSGRPSATQAFHVEEDLGSQIPVLDGGMCERGIESSILHYRENRWHLIRRGILPGEAFIPILGYEPLFCPSSGRQPTSPGQLFRHYAPRARLLLNEEIPDEPIDAIIGFRERNYPEGVAIYLLGSQSNSDECSQRLYTLLRQLDADQRSSVWVDFSFSHEGKWATLKERFEKASQWR